MPAKQLFFDTEARDALRVGVDVVANTVKVTLGPKGRNVALGKRFGAPTVTHDGVTVAKEIELKDRWWNVGAQLTKQAATKTNDDVGDGTTTATILAQAIIHEGLKNVAAGTNPMMLRSGLEQARDAVLAALKANATPVTGRDDLAHIATIASGDERIGEVIANAIDKVGHEGVVTIEDGRGLEYETDYVEGMSFDRGWVSPYLVTNTERLEAVLEDPVILVTDKRISVLNDIVPILEQTTRAGMRNLVIIADDLDHDALAVLVINKLRGNLNAVAVKAPGYGDRQKEMLEDIATLTGATVITESAGRKIDQAQLSDLGRARRVIAKKDETTIVEGLGNKSAIDARVRQIKRQIEDATSDFDKEKLNERLAKIAGGVAVVRVGGATESDQKERKYRVEDALNATRAAAQEGIVPGGGVALLAAAKALDDVTLDGDAAVALSIMRRALEEPLRQLAENAGLEGAVVASQVRRRQQAENNPNIGFEVVSEQYVDMLKAGVIDPVKVTRSALENGVSIAMMLLTTDVLVTEIPDTTPQPQMPPMDDY
ncbi:MAG: chaperonin GroEL [Chloroflexi bacterium]|nr:chaperonin GroEL [Chloroflexota bacterium]